MIGCRVGPLLVTLLVTVAPSTPLDISAPPGAVDWNTHGFLYPLPIADPESENPACRKDSLRLVAALKNRTLWAEQMWDASAKTPVGLMTGTTVQLGDFDECLGVRAPVEAQYCLVTLGLAVPAGHAVLDPETEVYPPTGSAWDKTHYGGSKAKQRLDKVKVALCVPSSCTPEDLRTSLSRYLQRSNQSVATAEVEDGACSKGDDPGYGFTSGDVAFWPLWNAVVRREQDQCSRYWWVNLLFLNNYLGGDKMCLLQTWYIACDFQLFLAGTLLLLLLNRRPLVGLPLSAVLLAVGLAAPFLATYIHNKPALLTFYKGMWEQVRNDDVYLTVYSQAHYRTPGYLIGLLAGYAVFRRRTTELAKGQSWTLLGLGFLVCFLTYWSGALYTDPARPYRALEAALYAAANHAVFALGMTAVFWALIFGPKSWVSDIFSWRGFVPLSKLSYSMYLVHNIPQIASAAASRTPVKFDVYGLVSWTLSDLVLGLLMSLVLFLYIETPCRYIFKHLTVGKTQHLSVKTAEDVKDVKEVSDWSYRLTNP